MSLFTNRTEVKEFRGRYTLLMILLGLPFLVLVGRLWYLQMVKGEYYEQISRNNFIHSKPLPALRGRIKDQLGRTLADNREAFNVTVTPAFLPRLNHSLHKLFSILGLDSSERRKLLEKSREVLKGASSLKDLIPIRVAGPFSPEQEMEILRQLKDMEGLSFRQAGQGGSWLFLDSSSFPSRLQVMFKLKTYLGLEEEKFKRLKKRIWKARFQEAYREILVLHDIDRKEQLRLLEMHKSSLPGVSISPAYHRVYPYREQAAHVVGYTNEIRSDELKKWNTRGYRMGDRVGRKGVEKLFEFHLRGRDGEIFGVVDAVGRPKNDNEAKELLKKKELKQPIPGADIVLSLDIELQAAAYHAIARHAVATVIALDPRNGFIRAMVTGPSYDPNRFAGRITRREIAELSTNPLRPLLNKTIEEQYSPGSTFKVITAATALGAKKITEHTRFHCPGYLTFGRRKFRCHRSWGHGSVNLDLSLMYSCNVYHYNLGMRLGIDRVMDYAARFGLGRKTGIGLREAPGFLPSKKWYMRQNKGYYPRGIDLNIALGQGDIKATALQMALVYAAIANGGKLLRPQVVQSIVSADRRMVKNFSPIIRRKVEISDETFMMLRRGLTKTVNDQRGTAYWRRSRRYKVAGKTGTSQLAKNITKKDHLKTYEEKDHAVFIGFSPPENAEIVIAAIIEHGGHGASAAEPVVMRLIEAYFDLKKARSYASGKIKEGTP